jgi:hypothetical protein
MRKLIVALMIAGLLIPTAAMAMKHGDHDMDHGKMKHDGMSMGGEMIMLQDVEVDGVMASGHLLDTREKMAALGIKKTHHFMVAFMNTEGEGIAEGQVAIKIESPDGQISRAVRLMGMDGAFGADINLSQKGSYTFQIGTKLADGKKRQFKMHYDNS